MNSRKQICWCFKVFYGVFSNLTQRLFSELLDLSYSFCCQCCHTKPNDILTDECEERTNGTSEEFYKNVNRDGAETLLRNKQNGTFVIRPSKNHELGTLSLVQDDKIFHLNVRRREDGMIALGTEKIDEKCFQDVDSLINYYISNYLVLYSNGEQVLTLLLPYREKTVELN